MPNNQLKPTRLRGTDLCALIAQNSRIKGSGLAFCWQKTRLDPVVFVSVLVSGMNRSGALTSKIRGIISEG